MSQSLKQLSVSLLLLFSILSLSLSIANSSDFTTLLAFKSISDPSNSLSSWSNSSAISGKPCSSWLGVTCNPSTRRVTKLVLNNLGLTGSIEPLTNLTHLRHLSLHHNRLSSAPKSFASWPNLKHLYLSHNLLTGNFPDGISHLHRLHRLDLSYNLLSGKIPMTQLTHLPDLLTLRLEFNSFTGNLNLVEHPSSSISEFNVSGNELAGEIPKWLSVFPKSSFTGNLNLCGEPLLINCANRTVESNPTASTGDSPNGFSGERKTSKRKRLVVLISVIDAVAIMAVLATITCCFYKRSHSYRERNRKRGDGINGGKSKASVVKHGDEEVVKFDGCKGFSKVGELLKASAEMLGKGNVGTTYKVVMEGGDVVVVKRVKGVMRKRKSFDGLLRVIGGLRHPNVVSLRAYYYSMDELLLVYDHLPNGSLHSLLHENRGPGRTPLDWTTRLKLAAGSAKGLAFLHSFKSSKLLFHGHLTTSNIIVDNSGNARVTDIGLHQLLPQPPSSPSSNAYKSPELQQLNNGGCTYHNAKFQQKCDVHSFGVVLLEILTGKTANFEGGRGLVKWVQSMVADRWTQEVFDFELWRYKEMEQEMVGLLQVALLCLAASPVDRPEMAAVDKMIGDIRKNSGGSTQGGALSSDSSPSLSESTVHFTSS